MVIIVVVVGGGGGNDQPDHAWRVRIKKGRNIKSG